MRVIVTGASRGIGAALCQGYAARGDDAIGTDRAQVDFAKPETISPWAAGVGGPIDLLICNAGVYLDAGQSLEAGYPAEMWSQTFAVNVTGVFLTVQSLLPQIRASRAPKIAILSSQMGSSTRAKGTSLIYRVSKAAVLNLGLNLSQALKQEGIAVGVYHPGWVRTDMGGAAADISVEAARDGLIARFDALSLETSGCFETWDGRAHPL
ncbi:MAG: SDR family NAD(P)-dependent oxidoreductase [Pseudomonadota bacterium]